MPYATLLGLWFRGTILAIGLTCLVACSWRSAAVAATPEPQRWATATKELVWGDTSGPFDGPAGESKEAAKAKIAKDSPVPVPATRSEAAEADFISIVKTYTGWAIGIFTVAAVANFVLSLFIPWLCRTCSLWGVVAVVLTIAIRGVLLSVGWLAIKIVAWILVGCTALAGIAILVSIIKAIIQRGVWNRGMSLISEGKVREGVVALASVNPRVDKSRKEAVTKIESVLGDSGKYKQVIKGLTRGATA